MRLRDLPITMQIVGDEKPQARMNPFRPPQATLSDLKSIALQSWWAEAVGAYLPSNAADKVSDADPYRSGCLAPSGHSFALNVTIAVE
jgi:hypothetical protein